MAGRAGGLAVREEEAFSVGMASPELTVQGVVTDRQLSKPPGTQQVKINITPFEPGEHRALHVTRSSVRS